MTDPAPTSDQTPGPRRPRPAGPTAKERVALVRRRVATGATVLLVSGVGAVFALGSGGAASTTSSATPAVATAANGTGAGSSSPAGAQNTSGSTANSSLSATQTSQS